MSPSSSLLGSFAPNKPFSTRGCRSKTHRKNVGRAAHAAIAHPDTFIGDARPTLVSHDSQNGATSSKEVPRQIRAATKVDQKSKEGRRIGWVFETPKSLVPSFPSQLRFGLPFWNGSGGPAAVQKRSENGREAQLVEGTADRAIKVGQEQSEEKESESKEVKRPPLDVRHFLHKIGIMEMRYMRMLASLCNLTYYMKSAVSEKSLFRRHGLRLVTTSLIFEKMVRESPKTPLKAADEGDGMAAGHQTVSSSYDSLLKPQKTPEEMQAIEKLKEKDKLKKMPTPAEVVGARLLSAYEAIFSVAAPWASNLSNISHATSAAVMGPFQALASQLQTAASIGQSTALATIATVTAALDTTWGQSHVTQRQAISSSYWFVADDQKANTRFFVIQGSNNIDHWKINLQFDPVTFEEPSLGLKVHRGFYEAAKILYDQFLPLVEEHLASDSFAKIVFTGHSLGGSVSSLLMLMFHHRKVIPTHALGPVYTFGAPAIFCETDPPSNTVSKSPSAQYGLSRSSQINRVLERMGLNSGAIRNIMMHRDIVPRAFACDYALVTDLLALVSDSFKNLECLRNPERQVMYHPLGRTLILQPDEKQNFVYGGADHPMLPPGPNLYTLRERKPLNKDLFNAKPVDPSKQSLNDDISDVKINSEASLDFSDLRSDPDETEARRTGKANLGSDGSNIDDSGPDRLGGAKLGPKAKTLNEAVAAIMDTPHPLEVLGEPGSYGFTGAISRYHDPDHYCKALGGVLRSRNQPYKTQTQRNSLATSDQIPKLSNISAGWNFRQRRNKDSVKPMLQLLDTQSYNED